MKFPHGELHDLGDAQQNFEFLEGSNIFWGSGVPTFIPDGNAVSFYLRKDTPTVANQRIYVYTGAGWLGIV